jgi:hypothetical protein
MIVMIFPRTGCTLGCRIAARSRSGAAQKCWPAENAELPKAWSDYCVWVEVQDVEVNRHYLATKRRYLGYQNRVVVSGALAYSGSKIGRGYD